MTPDREPRVLMGVVTKAHGIKGQVVVKWFGDDPDAAGQYETLEDEAGRQTFRVIGARPHKADTLVVRLADVDDRDKAEALRGTELYVRRSAFGPPPHGAFYVVDLVGLVAIDDAGNEVGRVVDMHNYGAGDIIEIAPAQGGDTMMLPFAEDFVPEVVPGKHVVVVLPAEDPSE